LWSPVRQAVGRRPKCHNIFWRRPSRQVRTVDLPFFYCFPSWDQTRASLEIDDGGVRQVKLLKLELARDRGNALEVRQRL
jgi:hypothetical protein